MSDWERVAAPGTAPQPLRRAVALAGVRGGRARLDRALAEGAPVPRPGPGALHDADRAAAVWAELGVVVALRDDPAWPRLRCLDPPALLAHRGPPRAPDRPVVALVGARRATGYGRGIAAWLAEAAGSVGAEVVSGGAVGIDAAAHEAAVGTGTTVVLGCGHDVAYPRPHARPGGLFDRVLEAGGALLSEQLPGARAVPWAVRARNRLVAGLADVVVVVEGGARSGSLLTATAAAAAGVPVLAVPGDVRAPGSEAPHRLLREGAAPCTGPQDLLAHLPATTGGAVEAGGDGTAGAAAGLPPALLAELVAAWPRPRDVAGLVAATGLPVGSVLAATTRGSVAGVLVEGADGIRLRRAP